MEEIKSLKSKSKEVGMYCLWCGGKFTQTRSEREFCSERCELFQYASDADCVEPGEIGAMWDACIESAFEGKPIPAEIMEVQTLWLDSKRALRRAQAAEV